MKREEKRQKLHEGLLRMLYPPPPSPPSQEETDHGPEKLTRAQRKKIRRKKLKEASTRRQNIIGPLLPTEEIDREDVNVSAPPQGVRQNANETGRL
uniref:Uncharacterized protein n=1 Tax=Solanum tuberosum TaxID=4113 RepID=M1BXG4_SOLTU